MDWLGLNIRGGTLSRCSHRLATIPHLFTMRKRNMKTLKSNCQTASQATVGAGPRALHGMCHHFPATHLNMRWVVSFGDEFMCIAAPEDG